jgi:TetR/AcrR family transcriptional repressor of mexJK operon
MHLASPRTPGRPKDPGKRAAILAAAKRLFPVHGFEATGMDAIATEAGVSKLTVYSHYKDKESLFVAAVRARIEEQLPDALFEANPEGSLRARLGAIARAFFALVTSPEAISLHRLMAAGIGTSPKLAQLFWEAGPKRTQEGFASFLDREVAVGSLVIDDVPRAASQFFCLLKGDLHARSLCGCVHAMAPGDIDAHIEATVDVFLRAYGMPRDP